MKNSKLLYVGIKGSVVALDPASGQQVWATRLKGNDFVNLIVQDDTLVISGNELPLVGVKPFVSVTISEPPNTADEVASIGAKPVPGLIPPMAIRRLELPSEA